MNAKESLFQWDGAHISEAAYFDDLAEDGEQLPLDPEAYLCRCGRTL